MYHVATACPIIMASVCLTLLIMSNMTRVPTHYMQNKTQKSNPEFMHVQTTNSNYLS